MFFNCNSLLVASIASTGTGTPRATVSDAGDIALLSVLEAVGNLDPLPSLLGISNTIGNNLVLTSFPEQIISQLLSLEFIKNSDVVLLSLGAGCLSSDSVGVEAGRLRDLPCFPLVFNSDEFSIEGLIKSEAFGISLISCSSESLV